MFYEVIITAVAGLRLTELVGPPYPDRGDDVRLTCTFDTEGAKLYSVKWYKDENEFFRYMPDNWPQTQVFTLVGVELDVSLLLRLVCSEIISLETILCRKKYDSSKIMIKVIKTEINNLSLLTEVEFRDPS